MNFTYVPAHTGRGGVSVALTVHIPAAWEAGREEIPLVELIELQGNGIANRQTIKIGEIEVSAF